jgi:hypothetical protein
VNAISQLQQAIIGRLTATDAQFPSLTPANGQITWMTEDIGDLLNAVTKVVGSLGIVGVVMTPGGGKMYEAKMTYPITFKCFVEIQILENVTVNRGAAGTQIPMLDLLVFCLQRLHNWSPTGQRINKMMINETPFVLVEQVPILTYNVRFDIGLSV